MTRKIKPADASTEGSIEIALALLERARAELKRAGADKAVEAVREAKKSAEGALRHARHRLARTPDAPEGAGEGVKRAVVIVDVFGEDRSPRQFGAAVEELELAQIGLAIDTGDWIGSTKLAGAASVTRRQLKPMMKAVGNADGSFFG